MVEVLIEEQEDFKIDNCRIRSATIRDQCRLADLPRATRANLERRLKALENIVHGLSFMAASGRLRIEVTPRFYRLEGSFTLHRLIDGEVLQALLKSIESIVFD